MNRRDSALDFLRRNGPSLPSALAHYLGSSIMLASAVLSELTAHKLVKISKLKIGGSPIYYLDGQEPALENIFYTRLNEKDKKTYDLLKAKRVLKDNELDPLTRVSLKNLGDFAVPISVNVSGEKILFWKWFLTAESDLKSILDSYFNKKEKGELPSEKDVNNQREVQSKLSQEAVEETVEKAKEVNKEEPSSFIKLNNSSSSSSITDENLDKFIGENPPEVSVNALASESDFFKSVVDFLKSKQCEIKTLKRISKREFELVVVFSSPFGSMEAYCYAWDKKKFNESDISKVFLNAYLRKLPAVLLTHGELTKRARNLKFNVVITLI